MTTFVLVHGAWHGAWAWYEVDPRLEARGHAAITFDLPAHGTDLTPPHDVDLDAHADRVEGILDEQDEQVVLVGHSMGGTVISQVAERRPDDVETLVYLSAFLLEDGQTLQGLSRQDEESVVTLNMIVDEERGLATVSDDAIEEAFYADCSESDVALARSLLRPEPLASFTEPVRTSEERFGRVRRAYIGCAQDRAITPDLQDRMRETVGVDEVLTLDTGHSPFFAAPGKTVDALVEVADAA